MDHDFERCFGDVTSMSAFTAVREVDARRYGKTVRALAITNREYLQRFNRLGGRNNMKPPPGSHIHIMPGYLVVRRVGTSGQYETWMPEDVFEELYAQTNGTPKA